MANLLKRKQVAALLGKTPAYIGMNVKRGQLIEVNKFIDTDHPTNKKFISKFTTKEVEKNENASPEKGADKVDYDSGPVTKANVEYRLKKEQIHKTEAEVKLKSLELLKKKAKVLPLDFVIGWSGRNLRGVFGETINFGNSIIEQICNEMDADIEIKLKFKKKFKQGFSEVLEDGIKKQKPEAIEYAKEYSLLTKW